MFPNVALFGKKGHAGKYWLLKRGIVKYVKTRHIIYTTGNIYLRASLYGLKIKMIN